MTSANIIADISTLSDRDRKTTILDYLTRHFLPSVSQQGTLIGELRKFSGFHCRHHERDGRQVYKCKDFIN